MSAKKHTVEKIGGTSMSRFGEILDNVIIGNRTGNELYGRIFVVSAYGGITDLLLESKKSGDSGVYGKFAGELGDWAEALDRVKAEMCRINADFAGLGLDTAVADAFVDERIEGIQRCLLDVLRLCSYGHFRLQEYLPAVREMLSAIGEAHGAFNSVQILQGRGINAVFADLTGWMEMETVTFDDKIRQSFAPLDVHTCLPVATGYVKCLEGLMGSYDRGYSEITFSRIATITGAHEGVIHKEYHLCSGDPKLLGEENVTVIGHTSFDVADQLADLGMEAIHPKASKGMELANIPIRVRNAFDPTHPGTLISTGFKSESPRVEIVTGSKHLLSVEVWDPDMVGQSGYDYRLLSHFHTHNISYVAKNTNANTITHYVSESESSALEECVRDIKEAHPTASVQVAPVAIVSVIGNNMNVPGFLAKAANAMAEAGINILACDQDLRQVNMQFIVACEDFDGAVRALHKGLIECGDDA